jgi:uncharacterized membrane protein
LKNSIHVDEAPAIAGRAAASVDGASARLPIVFFALGALLAIAYALIVPPFQVPDEERHLWRAYSVSELHFLGPEQTQIPKSFVELNQRFPRLLETMPGKRAVRNELAGWLRKPLNVMETVGVENTRANLYSFVPYLTTALALETGRLAKGSPLALLYAGRLANAAVYLCLIYMSLRILPQFHLLLLTIALSPMSLHVAASFSADSLTLGLSALFTAYVFRLAFDDQIRNIRPRNLLVLVTLLVLLALCKFNVFMAILVALIPKEKFGSRTKATLSVAGCALSAVAAAMIWQRVNHQALSAFQALDWNGSSAANNAWFVLTHPIRFCGTIVVTDIAFFWTWCQEFVGTFGHTLIPLTWPLVLLYFVAVRWAALTRSGRVTIAQWQGSTALLFVFLTFISLHVLLWVLETPPRVLADALATFPAVAGIQGRYFIPLALPALVLVKPRFDLSGRPLTSIVGILAMCNIFALRTVWLAFS